jgi:hypothetical protein
MAQLPATTNSLSAEDVLQKRSISDSAANQPSTSRVISTSAGKIVSNVPDKAGKQQQNKMHSENIDVKSVPNSILSDKAGKQLLTTTNSDKAAKQQPINDINIQLSKTANHANEIKQVSRTLNSYDDNATNRPQRNQADTAAELQQRNAANQSQQSKPKAKTTFRVFVNSSSLTSSSAWPLDRDGEPVEIVSDWQKQENNGGRPAYYLYSAYQV